MTISPPPSHVGQATLLLTKPALLPAPPRLSSPPLLSRWGAAADAAALPSLHTPSSASVQRPLPASSSDPRSPPLLPRQHRAARTFDPSLLRQPRPGSSRGWSHSSWTLVICWTNNVPVARRDRGILLLLNPSESDRARGRSSRIRWLSPSLALARCVQAMIVVVVYGQHDPATDASFVVARPFPPVSARI